MTQRSKTTKILFSLINPFNPNPKFKQMAELISWFEIPVNDMPRARAFYSKVFQGECPIQEIGGATMAFLPRPENQGIGGALIQHKAYVPSQEGTLLYFSARSKEELIGMLTRINEAGGKVIQSETEISSEIGFMALALDSEGNRIAFYRNP